MNNSVGAEIKRTNTKELDKKTPFTWRLAGWVASPCIVFGIFTVYTGWDTLLNKNNIFGDSVISFQLAASIGTGTICTGIAAILLGGICAIIDVLVKTRSKQ
jgi:hypothetical protein